MTAPLPLLETQSLKRLAMVFSPHHIFVVGNAWGYSTLVLSCIFGGASVDVIDAGTEGTDERYAKIVQNK